MKFKNKALLIMGETAAFGWFILQGLSFVALLPLPILGWIYYRLMKNQKCAPLILNGFLLSAAILIGSLVVAEGLFQGRGMLSLLFLLPAAGILGFLVSREELMRISRWWMIGFAIVFILMLLATLPGMGLQPRLPPIGNYWEIFIFYLLAFLEPLSLGKDYAAAPLTLSALLIPFGIAAFFALGAGAYSMAEFPYLSVWSGVAFLSVHHTEGLILGFYYGAVALRSAEFFLNLREKRCIKEEIMIE